MPGDPGRSIRRLAQHPGRGIGVSLVGIALLILATSEPAWAPPEGNPTAPVDVTVSPGNGEAVVSWYYYDTFDVQPDQFVAQTQNHITCATDGGVSVGPQPPPFSCTLTGLTNGHRYGVTVHATYGVTTKSGSTREKKAVRSTRVRFTPEA
jgi:hypothetical protein